MSNVCVLFARRDSIYKSFDVDVFDIDRDALNYQPGKAVVAHPPCRAWGQLSHFSNPRLGEKWLAVWSILQIRRNGGVLEHPRSSRLWKVMRLPMGNEIDEYGGYTLSVNQSWWGHKAQKSTLLYVCGCPRKELPDMPISYDCVTQTVSSVVRKKRKDYPYKKRITKKEREATPVALAQWLINVAEKCNKNNR